LSVLADRLLSSRKGLRDFRQQEEPGEKCSLCGLRQALHPEGEVEYSKLRAFWETLRTIDVEVNREKIKLAGRIRRGDRFCAVCLTKRLAWEHSFLKRQFQGVVGSAPQGQEHLLFPSTSTIATAAFKARLLEKLKESEELCQAVKAYTNRMLKLLRPSSYDIFYYSAPIPRLERLLKDSTLDPQTLKTFLRLDGDWLYEESFDPEVIARECGVEREKLEGVEEARSALRALLEVAGRFQCGRPSRYYALLVLDGDQMGWWLSGRKAPLFQAVLHPKTKEQLNLTQASSLLGLRRPLGPSLHMALSDAMKSFALYIVGSLVEEAFAGKLIYAGGDDVAAFVPLADLSGVLRGLHRYVSGLQEGEDTLERMQIVAPGFARRDRDGSSRLFMLAGKEFTVSAGVVIAHHTHPFSHVVEKAFEAMKHHAKEQLGRSSFAIHLIKRSGEPLEVGARWVEEVDGKSFESLAVLENVQRLFAPSESITKKLSPRLISDMKAVALGLQQWPVDLVSDDLLEAQKAELRRLLGRHAEGMKREEIQELHSSLADLLGSWETQYREWTGDSSKEGKPGWERLINFLLLARFLAEEA
jgi:CRISPR-associated protein Cmr2